MKAESNSNTITIRDLNNLLSKMHRTPREKIESEFEQ